MNKVEQMNPEHFFSSSKKDVMDNTDELRTNSTYQTADYCTQVNLDDEFFQEQKETTQKKSKRKSYKQRKKQKKQNQQRSAKIKLADIIEGIYAGQTEFETQKIEIEKCLGYLTKGDKFHAFLNQTIKLHVSNIQKNLWEYMQQIIEENPFEKSEEDQEFYLLIVERMYAEYELLKDSSAEIEKIINLFMKMTSDENYFDQESHELDRNTFNYLIESQENIKNLIRICQQRISHRYTAHVQKLKEIASMMNTDDYQTYLQEEERSTSIEEEELERGQSVKKKKKKNKDKEYSCRYEDVLNKLSNLSISRNDRSKCNVHDEWLEALSKKVKLQN